MWRSREQDRGKGDHSVRNLAPSALGPLMFEEIVTTLEV